MYYAQITHQGIVIAITEASGQIVSDNMIPIASYDASLLGCTYSNGEFLPPASPPAPAWQWYIDIGPFYDRFGAAKMAVLTSADPGVRAILADLNIRKWMDLKRPDVSQALAYVGSVVPAVTATLRDAILNTPVADIENLALRRLYFSV